LTGIQLGEDVLLHCRIVVAAGRVRKIPEIALH
jgi:hypothetical protein